LYKVRLWSVKQSRPLEVFYTGFEKVIVKLHPLWKLIGYERLENPFAVTEKVVKGFLFDCQMCGQCALSSTGMSCPMNCPKHLRNGPCGGVRSNGNCQFAVNHQLQGRSSWLAVARDKNSSGDVSE